MRNAIEDFLGYFEKICPGVLLTADVLSTPEECDLTTYHCLAMAVQRDQGSGLLPPAGGHV